MFINKPKHIIFLVHGIAGNKTHFGYMIKALRRVLHKKDPSTKYIIRNVEYDTGHDEKVPYDFAKDLAQVIDRYASAHWFGKEDKISLIMHSQGGLIGSIWMFQSLLSNPEYSKREVIDHLDAFITLGTPFWGAKIAQWGKEVKTLTKRLGMKLNVPFGEKELEEMSFGSDMIYDFRQALIDEEFKEPIAYLKNNVRFLNIVGVADVLNPLGIFVSGVEKYEDDGAVPLTCARFNFLYSQSIKEQYNENDHVPLQNTKEIDMAPYVVVNAMHQSPVPEMENFPGIAQISKKCLLDDTNSHPSFPYIWNHILGNEVQQIDKRLGNFQTFLIDLNIRVNDQVKINCREILIEFRQLDGTPISGSNIEISNKMELYSKGHKQSKTYPHHCRFYYTGHIKRSLDNRQEGVLVRVTKPGFKGRLIEVKLKPSYSTFIDINLIENDSH